jgi:hypothetical protein
MARKSSPGTLAVTIIVVLCAAVVPLLLYALWEFWPTAAVLKTDAGTVDFFGFRHTVSTEVRLFVVVAIGGALGGIMHSTRSVAWYVGNQNLRWRWVPFYLVTIVLGAGLATIFYLLIRGGLFQGAGVSDANPYGFVALGALVGLFTEQALVMLRKIATEVFAQAETGKDSTKLIATTGDPANVEDVSASLTGEATAEIGPVTYQFEYGTTTAYGSLAPDPAAQADEPTVSADIPGLTPGTEYHYRLVVKNSAGKTAEGSDKTFTTKAAAEESPPTNS